MAASVAGVTPVKTYVCFKKCMLCNSDTRRLHVLSKNKAVNANFKDIIQDCLSVELDLEVFDLMHVCDPCVNTCEKYLKFKTESVKNLEENKKSVCRTKRQAKTPPSLLKLSISPSSRSVASQIERSVEKLKRMRIEDGECKTRTGVSRSRVQLQFNGVDHQYTKRHSGKVANQEQFSSPESILHDIQENVPTYCQSIGKQLQSVCKPGHSLLFNKDPGDLMEKNWFTEIILEMKRICPDFLSLLSCAVGDAASAESKLATIATVYGMVMHSRNVRASAIQRLYTALAIRFHADNKLLERLNKVHITLSHETKRNIMAEFGDFCEEKLIQHISDGKDGKINGDNLDLYVRANDIRLDHTNKDIHYFASDWTADRINLDKYDNTKPLQDVNAIDISTFLLSLEETKIYMNSLKIVLARVLVKYVDELEWMRSVIPNHIQHPLEDTMAQKSCICWLPIQLKNEAFKSDCIQIMDCYEKMISKWYQTAGKGADLENLLVPVGGDQLTRVRLQSAGTLRAGAHTAQERLEHLQPVICEMFHTLQDFIEKLYKRFFNTSSGRDPGTLYQMKMLIQRTNVNGNVKSRFEAHEDFVLTAGCAYFLGFLLKFFDMTDLTDAPKHPLLKKNIKMMHTKDKEQIFNAIMQDIVDQIFEPYQRKDKSDEEIVRLTIDGSSNDIKCMVTHGYIKCPVTVRGYTYTMQVELERAKAGQHVTFTGKDGQHVHVDFAILEKPADVKDDLNSYVQHFMQWYFLILSFKDAVKEGDIVRNNIHMKLLIPFFYGHSALSKYMTECIDYILKTEVFLSERMAVKVRAASFVNVHGKQGENKAADLQKENQVLVLKDLIRGLGANKTEKAVVTVSKAAAVIQSVVDNMDHMMGLTKKNTTHKKKSFKEDVIVLLDYLKKNNPWTPVPDRKLKHFSDISSSAFRFDDLQFKMQIMGTVNRLKRDLPEFDDGVESD